MRKLISFIGKYYKGLYKFAILFILFSLANSYIQLRIPIISQIAIDSWIESIPGANELITLAIKIFILLVLTILLGIGNRFLGAYLSSTVALRIRKNAINHIQKLPLKEIDNKRTGDLITRAISDVESISDILYKVPESILNAILLLGGSIFTMYRIDKELTLLLILVIPIFLILNIYLSPKARKLHKKSRTEYGKMISNAESICSGIKVTKSFNSQEYVEEKFNKLGNNYKKIELKEAIYDGLFRSSEILMREGFRLITIVYGGYKVAKGEITVGELILFQALMFAFLRPINILIRLYPDILKSLGSFDKLYEIMSLKEENYEGKTIYNLKGKISFNNLSFKYEKNLKNVLNGIDFNIYSGQKIGIVGRTGCGKTTLLNLLMRFYDVENNSIYIDDKDIMSLSPTFVRDNIGIVHQDVHIFASTIKENLLIAKPDAKDNQLIEALKFADAYNFISKLPQGINTFVGERGIKLSGGQRQRITIARIFLKNPKILLLDESTSSLDVKTENKIQKTLEKLEKNRTIIIVAHRLSTIMNCDKIVYIEDGKIKESGTHEELLNLNGRYKALYQNTIKYS